jgi:hypothetical protein
MTTVFRNRWLEVAMPCHNVAALTLSNYHEHESLNVSLFKFGLYFKLPKFLRGEVMEEAYGFYFGEDALVLEWNRKRKFLHYPWALDFVRWLEWREEDYYGCTKQGGWVEVPRNFPHGRLATPETWEWNYTLRSGKVQTCAVTAYRTRSVHRRRWLPAWLPLFQKVFDGASFEFSREMGEGEGSWKGGTLGISAPIRLGESLPQMLDRLAADGSFKR